MAADMILVRYTFPTSTPIVRRVVEYRAASEADAWARMRADHPDVAESDIEVERRPLPFLDKAR